MTRQEFMNQLYHYLAPLAENDRMALCSAYDARFAYELQAGRTEADIAAELGDPFAIAREAVGRMYAAMPARPEQRRDAPRMIGIGILLFFVNLVAIPFGAAMWSFFAAAAVAAAALLASLMLLFAETQIYGGYETYKLYVAFGMTGIGCLLAAAIPTLWKWISGGTLGFLNWNMRTWKGRP